MEDKRRLWENGTVLELGGIRYCLESVEGCGGSAIVYRASYEDHLNQGFKHYVFIKELFPYDPKGTIYRDETGKICCTEDGRKRLEQCRVDFFRGNQANLQLLEQVPEQISGNLNSFEANGTFYSVLSVHGGRSLAAILREKEGRWTLKETAEIILKILDALDCFHQKGILHLDISPDNILLTPKGAFLIDYNSVWMKDGAEEYRFCVKDGYSAPEVWLEERENVCTATDLYSVCAVWFVLLTKRALSDEEIMGNGLQTCFTKDMDVFRDEPVTAVWKTVGIIRKGLHMLTCKRYQSVSEIRGEIEEMIRRIEGKGISQAAVWESSHKSLVRQNLPEGRYLEQQIRLNEEETGTSENLTLEECARRLESGECMLLKGPGGMGKTRFLREVWSKYENDYDPSRPAAVYIPLSDYQQADEEPFYIRKCLLRGLNFGEQVKDFEGALHEWNCQLEAGRTWSLILLLDGFNEAGTKRRELLKEIEELGRISGVGILVTDRSDSVKGYGFSEFHTAELLPLTETAMERELYQSGLNCPKQPELRQLLCTPMMLLLYQKTALMAEESGGLREWEDGVKGVEELIGAYLDSLFLHEQRVYAGNQKEQLRQKYLIRHFLPEIARELKRQRRTILTREELHSLAEKTYKNLNSREFAMAFPEYLGKSRIMLEGIADSMQWFDYAVEEQLWGRLNLLAKSSGGNYSLVHDNFLEYLAEKAKSNRKIVKEYGRHRRRRNRFLAVAAIVLLGGGIYCADRWITRKMEAALSEAEDYLKGNDSHVGWIELYMRRKALEEKEEESRAAKEEVESALEDAKDDMEALDQAIKEEVEKTDIKLH